MHGSKCIGHQGVYGTVFLLLLGVPCHGMVDLIPIQEEAQGRFELCLQEVQFHGPLFIGYKLL